MYHLGEFGHLEELKSLKMGRSGHSVLGALRNQLLWRLASFESREGLCEVHEKRLLRRSVLFLGPCPGRPPTDAAGAVWSSELLLPPGIGPIRWSWNEDLIRRWRKALRSLVSCLLLGIIHDFDVSIVAFCHELNHPNCDQLACCFQKAKKHRWWSQVDHHVDFPGLVY